MLNFNWSEIFLIVIIALIVIGPKDIPKLGKILGYWVSKIRQLLRALKISWYTYADKLELDRLNDVQIDLNKLPTRDEIPSKSEENGSKTSTH